ncbi:hypothetical protein GYMLUDRAFT_563103 [Collybiopsis luxurians FD-317 M1]|uniref:Uncharacterized protein n=1 Tax=Collybiopsis luxurians FD-317 M1 TaxID=944289 RepID=A0A0D0CS49_9AGAR|nr:hypothetical protein GYMLUDRAFT_563103 [Collybiopsis luxurians FD-317 M1]
MAFSPAERFSSELIGVFLGCILFGFYISSAIRCSLILWNRFKASQKPHPYFLITHITLALLVTTRNIGALAFVIIPFVEQTYTLPPPWESISLFLNSLWLIALFVSDAFVCYRACIVWSRNIYLQILSITLLIGCFALLILKLLVQADYSLALEDQERYLDRLGRRTIAFAGTSLAINLINTGLIAFRIWTVRRRTMSLGTESSKQLTNFATLLVESAALYTVVLVVDIIFISLNNVLFLVFQEIQTPFIGIVFTNIIVTLSQGSAFGCTSNTGDTSQAHPPTPAEINMQTIITSRSDRIELPTSKTPTQGSEPDGKIRGSDFGDRSRETI